MESPETFAGLVAWSIVIGATLFTILTGVVLSYHWFRYSFNKNVSIIALCTYTVISIILLSLLINAAAHL